VGEAPEAEVREGGRSWGDPPCWRCRAIPPRQLVQPSTHPPAHARERRLRLGRLGCIVVGLVKAQDGVDRLVGDLRLLPARRQTEETMRASTLIQSNGA
jgi:hypothetical protein